MFGLVAPCASYPIDGVASVSKVRNWLATLRDDGLFEADDDHLYDIQLACTELAMNAIEHAQPPWSVHLAEVRHDAVLIEVVDGSPLVDVVVGTSRVGPTRGRGLTMVAALARGWGVVRRGDAKVSWAWLDT